MADTGRNVKRPKMPFYGERRNSIRQECPAIRDMAGADAGDHDSEPECGKPRADDTRDFYSGDDAEPAGGELAAVSDTRLVQPWTEREGRALDDPACRQRHLAAARYEGASDDAGSYANNCG